MRSCRPWFRYTYFVAAVILSASVNSIVALAQSPPPAWGDVGTPMTPEEIKAMPMDTGPSGKDLPPGSGTAKQGEQTFAQKCAMCHGQNLEGYIPPPGSGIVTGATALVGGKGLPLWGKEGITPGISRANYAAYATTLWNSIALSMPAYRAGSLTPNEVYSLVALILARNEIIKEDVVLDRVSLPEVKMPQRDNYIPAKFDDIIDIMKRGCYKIAAFPGAHGSLTVGSLTPFSQPYQHT